MKWHFQALMGRCLNFCVGSKMQNAVYVCEMIIFVFNKSGSNFQESNRILPVSFW
jgi:hypothetical protein